MMKSSPWSRERVSLQLDDIWSRISHWQRRRRLLIDIAIGDIGMALGVCV